MTPPIITMEMSRVTQEVRGALDTPSLAVGLQSTYSPDSLVTVWADTELVGAQSSRELGTGTVSDGELAMVAPIAPSLPRGDAESPFRSR